MSGAISRLDKALLLPDEESGAAEVIYTGRVNFFRGCLSIEARAKYTVLGHVRLEKFLSLNISLK